MPKLLDENYIHYVFAKLADQHDVDWTDDWLIHIWFQIGQILAKLVEIQ